MIDFEKTLISSAMTVNNSDIPVLKVNADVFVRPHSVNKLLKNPNFGFLKESVMRSVSELSKINSIECNPEHEDVVHLWFVSDELKCDNMTEHFFDVIDMKGRVWQGSVYDIFAPKKIFVDHKEGDTINYKCRAMFEQSPLKHKDHLMPSIDYSGDKPWFDAILDMQLTLSQTKYHLKSLGNFEDALANA